MGFVELYAGWFIFVSVIFGITSAITTLCAFVTAHERNCARELIPKFFKLGSCASVLLVMFFLIAVVSVAQYNQRKERRDTRFHAENGCLHVPSSSLDVMYDNKVFSYAFYDDKVWICQKSST